MLPSSPFATETPELDAIWHAYDVSLVHFEREFPFIPSLVRRAGESEKHRLALFKP